MIAARGKSSAGSAAHATLSHVRDWFAGTPVDGWTSMAVGSDGSYGIPEGLVSSFPVTAGAGRWSIVPGLTLNAFSRTKIEASVAELIAEAETVTRLGLIPR